jgi:hypothetical protein
MSSKRRLRRRECTNKHRYSSEKEAHEHIAWLDKIGKLKPDTHAYRCRFGNHFHIGRGSQHQRRTRIKLWQWNR